MASTYGNNVVNDYIILRNMSDVTFKWFNAEGEQVPYGEHVPYLFEIESWGMDSFNVTKVVLPDCDYLNPETDPVVAIHCRKITYKDPDHAWEIKEEK